MINILLGPPGAGKSYEAVVYHVLTSLLDGRKVVTNLPLQVEAFKAYGIDPKLIELRHPNMMNPKPFSTIEDYGSDWRNEDGVGPLYVIDECHKALPKGMTSRAVEEWYAEHRHEGADVLLITQSYGKISQSIRDMVQICYRVRKATALGSDKRYIRKVQDGLRGEVMNENIRSYDPKRFCLYKSHTKSNSPVAEATAKDVKPFWKHWSVIGGAILVPLGLVAVMLTIGSVLYPDPEPTEAPKVKRVMTVQDAKNTYAGQPRPVVQSSPRQPTEVSQPVEAEQKKEPRHPYFGKGLHISAYIKAEETGREMYSISVSQNGQRVFRMSDAELVASGYTVDRVTPCLMRVEFGDYSDYITCDAPTQNVPL